MKFGWIAGALTCLLSVAPFAAVAADYGAAPRHIRKGHVRTVLVRVDPAVQRGFSTQLPACADPHIQGKITRAFAHRERGYWSSDLELSTFAKTRQIGLRTWGAEFIPRRFCAARTVTSDGARRHVYYVIGGSALASLGIGWGVEWCVTGLDRNLAYAPGCKMTQP